MKRHVVWSPQQDIGQYWRSSSNGGVNREKSKEKKTRNFLLLRVSLNKFIVVLPIESSVSPAAELDRQISGHIKT